MRRVPSKVNAPHTMLCAGLAAIANTDIVIMSIIVKFPLIYGNFQCNSRFGVDMSGSIRINKVIYRHHQH